MGSITKGARSGKQIFTIAIKIRINTYYKRISFLELNIINIAAKKDSLVDYPLIALLCYDIACTFSFFQLIIYILGSSITT